MTCRCGKRANIAKSAQRAGVGFNQVVPDDDLEGDAPVLPFLADLLGVHIRSYRASRPCKRNLDGDEADWPVSPVQSGRLRSGALMEAVPWLYCHAVIGVVGDRVA